MIKKILAYPFLLIGALSLTVYAAIKVGPSNLERVLNKLEKMNASIQE